MNTSTERELKLPTMRLVTIHQYLFGVLGGMGDRDLYPTNPNWLQALQDLLVKAGVDLEAFVERSTRAGYGSWPTFGLENGKLTVVEYSWHKRALDYNITALIQETYHKGPGAPPIVV